MLPVILTHKTALELYRTAAVNQFLNSLYTTNAQVPHNMPDKESNSWITDTLRKRFDGITTERYEILISRHESLHLTKSYQGHLCSGSLPRGSFISITPHIKCVSPLLLPYTMAGTLTELELSFLMSELMGTFCLGTNVTRNGIQRARSLVSIEQMLDFNSKMRGKHHANKVRRSLLRSCINAASIMEVKLYFRATFPVRLGGYAIDSVIMNQPFQIDTFADSKHKIRKPDLFFSPRLSENFSANTSHFCGIALDYHGSQHADKKTVISDDRRMNELLSYGIKDYVIWKSQYDDITFMDNLFKNIKRDLGIPERRNCTRYTAEQARKRRIQLWSDLEHANITHYW